MTDRELDRRCAEIMGWKHIDGCEGLHPPDQNKCEGFGMAMIPYFSTDLNASRELLEWTDSNGELNRLMGMTITRMLDKSPMDERGYVPLSMLRKIWLATPRQICEAFVETFGKEPR